MVKELDLAYVTLTFVPPLLGVLPGSTGANLSF